MTAGRPAIGKPIHVRLDDDLMTALDTWRGNRDMSRAEAVRSLLRSTLDVTGTQQAKTIWEVFPEAKSQAELDELVASDGWDIEGGEYEYDGKTFGHRYTKIRGHWIYAREDQTDKRDDDGLTVWTHTYAVAANEADAARIYRETIVKESQAWTPEHCTTMWMDCGFDNDSVEQLAKAGKIPMGTIDQDAADAAWAAWDAS